MRVTILLGPGAAGTCGNHAVTDLARYRSTLGDLVGLHRLTVPASASTPALGVGDPFRG